MQNENKNSNLQNEKDNIPTSTGSQEQSDPQITELRGFADPKEDLEPTLTDGTKVPDKAKEEKE